MGDAGRQVHVGNGSVAPADGSGWSRASAGLVLQRLHELSVLFSGGSAPSGVVIIRLLQPIRAVTGTSWCDIWCNDVLRNYSYPLGTCPGYVTIILDLLLRDDFDIGLCFKFCDVMCLQLTVLGCCPSSFGAFRLFDSVLYILSNSYFSFSPSHLFFSGLPPWVGYCL